ncbi:putative regulatory protein, FmdB family [Methylomagnum ishizawai]|uniref:Putative regulatory protein, FmdB family n=1 Tax=Methylomagnum ishizawai TaxID=1760988 RepID=A0A1Y6D4M0_9GAMM|nr:zinc ribbon domain-containing protein [Methylomagnum ishizawai]SMF97597.1 putative regulatory protein, FmdB family [Methylomagnum ishizawai]
MPIYDYHCPQCDKQFELLVSASSVPTCPHCGGQNLEKLLSLTAPQGKIPGIIAKARGQAAKEGHFSNYSKAERAKLKV